VVVDAEAALRYPVVDVQAIPGGLPEPGAEARAENKVSDCGSVLPAVGSHVLPAVRPA
jgi:hypothetical protein